MSSTRWRWERPKITRKYQKGWLTDELAVDPDAGDGRLTGPLQQKSLNLGAEVAHRVKLDGLERDLLFREEVLDLGAERAVGLGEDGDRVISDQRVHDLCRALLLAGGGHPGADRRA